ncbi:hypothetical protein HYH02_003361 [Chlamydomonas schloesseri]|uniref:NlpC/P60 domain-containing protein n=1 Tax=Chlamydomonas schloesseri TaxID=2026947 RepID=A0A835WR22_9CHLO|nr:hypothetical protein HYH02_003361 [Chlamydomonas schloesseri]|eukprot:KAG2452337.1 hypothetical protein HYH02_003361 [Chlamydomonas schloesseri]
MADSAEDALASGPSLQQAFAAFVLFRQRSGAGTKAAVAAAGTKECHKRKKSKKGAAALRGTSSKPGSPRKSPGASRKNSRPGSTSSSGSSSPSKAASSGAGPNHGSPRRRPKSPASPPGSGDKAGSSPDRIRPRSGAGASADAGAIAATKHAAGAIRPRSPPCSSLGLPLSHSAEERRALLRAQFLDLARSYIGVPYSKRYHAPASCACEGCSSSGRQLYYEPMFLDCCGLVRKVVRTMQRQLGFRLGPGNQAYQFDTLPLRVASVGQLRPGDLIFYSGTPYSPDARRYAFDMTHVEIFIGGATGEATLGSRERYKWVMEYDSYRFSSARWALTAHHFCSIDTWLDGLCAPQHPELWSNAWRGPGWQGQGQQAGGGSRPLTAGLTWNTKKYSIFGGVAAAAGATSGGGSAAKAAAAAAVVAAAAAAPTAAGSQQQEDDGESDGQDG